MVRTKHCLVFSFYPNNEKDVEVKKKFSPSNKNSSWHTQTAEKFHPIRISPWGKKGEQDAKSRGKSLPFDLYPISDGNNKWRAVDDSNATKSDIFFTSCQCSRCWWCNVEQKSWWQLIQIENDN